MSLALKYAESFVRHSVSLIALGFEDARPLINETTEEEVVTDRITRAANERLRIGNVSRALLRLSISDDAKVSNTDREGKHRRRIDIRVESTAIAGRPTLEVEAKCLRRGSHPIGNYTGSDGLELFVAREYAASQSYGAMLGYVQSNDATYWIAELLRSLRTKPSLVGDCEALTGFSFEHGHRSHHSRSDSTTIAIHHFLLLCR